MVIRSVCQLLESIKVDKWLNGELKLLLGHKCYSCGLSADEGLFCDFCLRSLPYLPRACRRCALPISPIQDVGLCGRCISQPPSFTGMTAVFSYEGLISQIIKRYKFDGELYWSRFLAEQLAIKCRESFELKGRGCAPELICPAPLHPHRLRARGFNQSALIAKRVARILDIPYVSDVLKRVRSTKNQAELNLGQRKQNLRHAFDFNENYKSIKRLAVVDDVVTTASTAEEISKLCVKIGLESVDIWTPCRRLSGKRY